MQVESFSSSPGDGWSVPAFPDLDSPDTLVLAFGGASLADAPAPLHELHTHYSESKIVGCSTSGEILGPKLSDDGLVVAVAKFERTRVADAAVSITADGGTSREAGRNLAGCLAAADLRAVFVVSDGLLVNGSELVRGISDVLPASVVVTGGLAGDGEGFERTWVIDGGGPVGGSITAVGLYGEFVHVGHGSKGGWDAFGPERRVTRSERNVLYELDGEPALDLYERYLGDLAEGLPATALLFPLTIREAHHEGATTVRTILGVDREHRTMTFAGDIPEGHIAQLMSANLERLVMCAADAGAASVNGRAFDDSQILAIAISCVGRRMVLGPRTEEELELLSEALPPAARQVGFYSYGEISPRVSFDGTCQLHNQTMTVTTLAEL